MVLRERDRRGTGASMKKEKKLNKKFTRHSKILENAYLSLSMTTLLSRELKLNEISRTEVEALLSTILCVYI